MSFTFITALYEIKREQHDKRSFAQYQEWFSKTLTLPFPLIIYTEEKNRYLIEQIIHFFKRLDAENEILLKNQAQ